MKGNNDMCKLVWLNKELRFVSRLSKMFEHTNVWNGVEEGTPE